MIAGDDPHHTDVLEDHDILTRTRIRYSRDEVHRYVYSVEWDKSRPMISMICLNPSTAWIRESDPTCDGMIKRAHLLGGGAFSMLNIFAGRNTDPADMKTMNDPIGPWNDTEIGLHLRYHHGPGMPAGHKVLCGWGNHGKHLNRAGEMRQVLRRLGDELSLGYHCFEINGTTGEPKHPLYVKLNAEPILFTP